MTTPHSHPRLRHSQNYTATATDSQVCLYQWTTKLWEAGICARPWAINGFTTKGDVEGPHELNHGIRSPWQCQDKAQTWAGLTVQNLTLTTGTTVSTLHVPGTMWSSLFALCHLKGLSDLIYITWLPQCLTQSDHWTNVSNKSDILLIFRGHFLCQTVCQAWSMHCLTSHNSPGRRVFLYVPISQMKTPSLSWAKWSIFKTTALLKPRNRRHAQPALASVLLPNLKRSVLKGHTSTGDTQPAVPVIATAEGLVPWAG